MIPVVLGAWPIVVTMPGMDTLVTVWACVMTGAVIRVVVLVVAPAAPTDVMICCIVAAWPPAAC